MDGDYIILEGLTVEQCLDEFIDVYQESEVGAYETLMSTKAPNLTITDQVLLFGKIMYQIEDDYLVRGNVNENWSEDLY